MAPVTELSLSIPRPAAANYFVLLISSRVRFRLPAMPAPAPSEFPGKGALSNWNVI